MAKTFAPIEPAQPAAQPQQMRGLAPKRQYMLVHHPANWTLHSTDDGHEWLPDVRRLQFTNGVNGARFDDQGRFLNVDDVAHRLEKKGFVIISNDSPAGRYLGVVPLAGGAQHHCFKWEQFEAHPGRRRPLTIIDEEQRNAFLRALYTEGVVPMPPPSLRQQHIRAERAKRRAA